MNRRHRRKMVRVVVLSGATTLIDSDHPIRMMDEIEARKLERNGMVRILETTQSHGGPQNVKRRNQI